MHTMPQHYGNEGYGGVGGDEVRRLQDELAHKDTVLKQLEVQFELYKEEHAKLLASKIEEQREAFNLEKDRINQHFIRTGQELHTKTDEYHQQVEENERLAVENKNLKEWLDKGVDACREVAEENERLKQELMYVVFGMGFETKQRLCRGLGSVYSFLTHLYNIFGSIVRMVQNGCVRRDLHFNLLIIRHAFMSFAHILVSSLWAVLALSRIFNHNQE